MRSRTPLRLALIAGPTLCASAVAARSALQRGVESYAIATCLGRQTSPYLKQQADGWGSAIVQHGPGGLEALRGVAAAVTGELAHTPVPMARDESRPMQPVAMPVQFCAEIIDRPPVRRAVDTAMKRLGPAYSSTGAHDRR